MSDFAETDLTDARQIVAALAAVADHLKPSDARLVQTWVSYLESAGDRAKVGKWRLEVLRRVAAEYSVLETRRKMNAKAKGNRNEHKSIRLLEAAGYACTRAAASLGVFDIVAVGADDVLLVQVKSNRWPASEEMNTIAKFAAPANCRKLIHRWRDRASAPDVREIER